MRVDWNEKICGVPIIKIRDVLRLSDAISSVGTLLLTNLNAPLTRQRGWLRTYLRAG